MPNSFAPALFEMWKKKHQYTILPKEKTTIFWLPSSSEIPSSFWQTKSSLLQNPAWLSALESHLPDQLEIGYLAMVQRGNLVAVSMIQLIDIPFSTLQGHVDDWTLPILSMTPFFTTEKKHQLVIRVMIAGNLFLLDHNQENLIPPETLHQAMRWLEKIEASKGTIALQVIKEISSHNQQTLKLFAKQGYHAISTEPEMVLQFEPDWTSIHDYILALTGKYRQRYRSARKKGSKLHRQRLTASEIDQQKKELQPLLDAVISNSRLCLSPQTITQFLEYKQALGDQFIFETYSIDDKLVGFTTAIHHNNELIAHRVGLDYTINRSHKLYQNMLYDYVNTAFSLGCQTIRYERTASEIKSAIGAEPAPLTLLLRHPGWLPNQLLKPLLQTVPEHQWTQRHPFRHRPAPPPCPQPEPKPCGCLLRLWLLGT